MVSFTLSLKLMSRMIPQHETFRRCKKCKRDTTPVKTNSSKTSNPFAKVSDITSTS